MDAESIIAVAAAVVTLTQLLKWSSVIPDRWGALAVLVQSLLGVALWAYSKGNFERATVFGYFAGWVSVSLSAAGTFGFTRAAVSAVTSATPPPGGGAGNSSTVKGE